MELSEWRLRDGTDAGEGGRSGNHDAGVDELPRTPVARDQHWRRRALVPARACRGRLRCEVSPHDQPVEADRRTVGGNLVAISGCLKSGRRPSHSLGHNADSLDPGTFCGIDEYDDLLSDSLLHDQRLYLIGIDSHILRQLLSTIQTVMSRVH